MFAKIRVFASISACLLSFMTYAQKNPINNETYKHWEKLSTFYEISNNGKYVSYTVEGNKTKAGYSIVLSSDRKWEKKLPYSPGGKFNINSRLYITLLPGDSLCILDLNTKHIRYRNSVNSFALQLSKFGEILVLRSRDKLILFNLDNEKEKVFDNVEQYQFNSKYTAALLQKHDSLMWMDLPTYKNKKIYAGKSRNWTFDKTGDQLAFIGKQANEMLIYYYKHGMERAEIKVSNQQIDKKYVLSDASLNFSSDDNHLFFKISKTEKYVKPLIKQGNCQVTVWSYKDDYLQSNQNDNLKSLNSQRFSVVVNVKTNKVLQLDNDTLSVHDISGDRYILLTNNVNSDEYFNAKNVKSYFILDLKTGFKRSFVPNNHRVWGIDPTFSASKRFIIWNDSISKNLFSYELTSGKVKNLTKRFAFSDLSDRHWFFPFGWAVGEGDDQFLLIRDQYDIWQIDLSCNERPINLTCGYGRRNKLVFDFAYENNGNYKLGDDVLLRVMDMKTKWNGFAKMTLGKGKIPIMGTLSPHLYSWNLANEPPRLMKAKNAETYLITRQSAAESPNLFISADLCTFMKLSFIEPEKKYNWLTSELHSYKLPNGKISQGILYKPENFDNSKKYPVIFYYYQEKSQGCNVYKIPALSEGSLEIPWYVSNEYIVFVPDIIYDEPGKITDITINSVVSAVDYLRKFSWINTKKMGLQGHSFGGYETNILITQTSLFAAAQSSSGPSNIISMSGALTFGGKDTHTFTERGQLNIGASLWERPDLYINNSPVLNAHRVSTPVLLEHGSADAAVPFAQSLEFFTALRRLAKPAWLLEYDYAGHILSAEEESLDFTIRQQQFFDHYLKDKPAPLWMAEGIRAVDKGIKNGLDLDSLNRKS